MPSAQCSVPYLHSIYHRMTFPSTQTWELNAAGHSSDPWSCCLASSACTEKLHCSWELSSVGDNTQSCDHPYSSPPPPGCPTHVHQRTDLGWSYRPSTFTFNASHNPAHNTLTRARARGWARRKAPLGPSSNPLWGTLRPGDATAGGRYSRGLMRTRITTHVRR